MLNHIRGKTRHVTEREVAWLCEQESHKLARTKVGSEETCPSDATV